MFKKKLVIWIYLVGEFWSAFLKQVDVKNCGERFEQNLERKKKRIWQVYMRESTMVYGRKTQQNDSGKKKQAKHDTKTEFMGYHWQFCSLEARGQRLLQVMILCVSEEDFMWKCVGIHSKKLNVSLWF